ncbi:MAG: hypothetical protein QM686_04310 [Herbaspirillum sp.]
MIAYDDREVVVEVNRFERSDFDESGLLPTDKSLSHRFLLFAALSQNPVRIVGLNQGSAVLLLLEALEMLNVEVRRNSKDVSDITVIGSLCQVESGELHHLNLGPSSAAARLLLGTLVGLGIEAIIDGDETLRARPFDWIVDPLRAMGGEMSYLVNDGALPIHVRKGNFSGGGVETRVGSAQAVSALLFAGLSARKPVDVRYPVFARNHTQILASNFGDSVLEENNFVKFRPQSLSVPSLLEVPKDPSAVAYPAALFWILNREKEEAQFSFDNVCLNPSRLGFFQWMESCGFRYETKVKSVKSGELVGEIVLCGGGVLHGSDMKSKSLLHSMIDEVPLAVLIACLLPGRSLFSDLHELTFKETDRITCTRDLASALGLSVMVEGLNISVNGGQVVIPSDEIPSFGDHRLSMTAHILLLASRKGGVVKEGFCFKTSFPEFDKYLSYVMPKFL